VLSRELIASLPAIDMVEDTSNAVATRPELAQAVDRYVPHSLANPAMRASPLAII
jgi:hypothetical protein